ncbi:hypothetical protein N7541_001715 [Penicillium brevicompactum]|uniref:Uncharacterized protein n=1 Tax=Penicillium brevicompactum TaxID=5074 RepID=A0A9W9RZ79_PENBR|nr:hypothetical protein N7541_001715 [Penicillium brevicompactum]
MGADGDLDDCVWKALMKGMISLPTAHLECIRDFWAPGPDSALLDLRIKKEVQPLLDSMKIWTKQMLVDELTDILENQNNGQDSLETPLSQSIPKVLSLVKDVGMLEIMVERVSRDTVWLPF